jgi:hypothetical protein
MRSPRSFLAGALLALALLSAPVFAQTVRFVDVDAAGIGDGSSWTDAFPDLQQALAVAEVGDEIWVAEGTYRPTDTADRDASFVLVSGTGLYGGFDGTEDARDERDPEAHITVLSGEIGDPDDTIDNAFHVVTASGVDGSTVLDGFTVTGGEGNGANPRNRGAGIYAENSSLVVRNCRIVENQVVQTDGFGGGGGAFFGTSGSPRFERVVFERNGLNGIGGGLWLLSEGGAASEAEVEAQHRAVEAKKQTGRVTEAGALSVVLREVSFTENTARFGGGVALDNTTFIAIESAFVRNVALAAAGGGLEGGGAITLVNTVFFGNRAEPGGPLSIGGGMAPIGATSTLVNVAFIGNVADFAGGLSAGNGNYTLTNVTFAANEANEEGGAIRVAGSSAFLQNAVFWRNGDEVAVSTGDATLRHVLIAGGCPSDDPDDATCEALLDADPLFVRAPDPGPDETWGTADDDYGDLSLQGTSPAVDFGLTSFLPPDTFDLDSDGDTAEPLPLDLVGEARVVGASVDLGAYEWQFPVASEPEPPRRSLSLDVYPNPARGPVAVSLHLDHADQAKVALFDMRGRRVAVLHDAPLAAGRHTLRLETATLSAGVYLVRIEGEAASLSRRLVVLR